MKKLLVPLSLVLLLFSSTLVLAEEDANAQVVEDERPSQFHRGNRGPGKMVETLMEKFGLNEENTLSDLLTALKAGKDERLQTEMEEYGVDTVEELREAKKTEHLETLRERLGLSEDATEEEILAAAKEARLDKARELLGLSEDASEEEIQEAMKEWKESHGTGNRPFWHRFLSRGGQ